MRRVGTDKMCCEIDWCDWIIGKASPFLEKKVGKLRIYVFN